MSDSSQTLFETALRDVPPPLRTTVENAWQALIPSLPALREAAPGHEWLSALARVFATSDFVARSCAQQPEVLRELLASGDLLRAYVAGEVTERARRRLEGARDEAELKVRLRQLRRREMLRIAFRDLAGWANLGEVMATLSELADACIDQALVQLVRWLNTPPGFVVLGMGKLGGRELNFSSDVDLIFVYAEDTEGEEASHHEQFVRLAQRLTQALSEATADGFVFRVDLRLRPHGTSGPLAVSFDAMENYYQAHGREWERYAFIKARVVAGDRDAGEELLARLRPFVFRKYLDYGAIESLRGMKTLIEREVSRKGMRHNVKLGPGGIREIEFIAQALQLIRGGREPPLQERALLPVLDRLVAAGHLESTARAALRAAYVFLRDTEHRLQMVADQQTHGLPADALGQTRLAFSMGFADWGAFEAALNRHRQQVQEQFSILFRAPPGETAPEEASGLAAVWFAADDEKSAGLLATAGYRRPEDALALLRGLRAGSACATMSAEGRARLDRLMPLLLAATALTREPEVTLARLVHLLETIGRRSVYLVLLIENPMALAQLVKLMSASPWIANWIASHPILLDELLDPRALYTPLAQTELAGELRARLESLPEDDLEMQMDVLREFRHGHVLRIAASDIASGLAPEQVGAHLAGIAEGVIDKSLGLARQALTRRHGQPTCRRAGGIFQPGFAVIGYGKLGGRELGYASDLDMIFLYEGCDVQGRTNAASRSDPQGRGEVEQRMEQLPGRAGAADEGMTDGARAVSNEEFFARLGQRLIHFLTTRTSGGILYEVDMRLRPSGKSGPLVAALAAFRAYQQTHAWTWEHQALVRARAVAGEPRLCAAFEEVRREVLCRPRDPGRLRTEVREMRRKMAATHAADAAGFNVKHDRGGIVDIEFMVQYAVLRWAHAHPALARHTDNIGILEALVAEGLLDGAKAHTLIEAYRRYLSAEHRLKLMERGSTVDRATLDGLPDAVAQIWKEMFEE